VRREEVLRVGVRVVDRDLYADYLADERYYL
jgi:hypothetical protein